MARNRRIAADLRNQYAQLFSAIRGIEHRHSCLEDILARRSGIISTFFRETTGKLSPYRATAKRQPSVTSRLALPLGRNGGP